MSAEADPGPKPSLNLVGVPAQLRRVAAGGGGVVLVEDRQRDHLLQGGQMGLARWAELMILVLQAEGVAAPWEVGLWFVAEAEMGELNHAHRAVAAPTDVLALGTDDGGALRASAEPRLVGDVVVCPVVADINASEHNKTLHDELALLVVHGTLHLLGYDHQCDADAAQMEQREQELLALESGGGGLGTTSEGAADEGLADEGAADVARADMATEVLA